MKCLICHEELEGFATPLCSECKQDNYLLQDETGEYAAFNNQGEPMVEKSKLISLTDYKRKRVSR